MFMFDCFRNIFFLCFFVVVTLANGQSYEGRLMMVNVHIGGAKLGCESELYEQTAGAAGVTLRYSKMSKRFGGSLNIGGRFGGGEASVSNPGFVMFSGGVFLKPVKLTRFQNIVYAEIGSGFLTEGRPAV